MAEIIFIEEFRANLRREIKRSKFTAKALCRAAQLNDYAVRDMLTKTANPGLGTVLSIAAALGVPPTVLIGGTVRLAGTIGFGGVVNFKEITGPDGQPVEVARPPLARSHLIALRVAGDILLPSYGGGDVLYIAQNHGAPTGDLLGVECICQVDGGPAYLRRLEAPGGAPDRFTLTAFNAAAMTDVQLAWAVPVLFVMRAHANEK